MLKITVVNKHHKQSGEYIGRGSPLGNPYPITVTDSREKVIARYRIWLDEKIQADDPKVCDELNRLIEVGLTNNNQLALQCFCKPHPCHGDVIREVILNALKEQ